MTSPSGAVAVCVALALAGCATGDTAPGATPTSGPAATTAVVPSDAPPATRAASCGRTTTVPEQAGSHLVGDNDPPVPYNSTPPTSGWHSSGSVTIGVYSARDPLSEPEQVSVLEAGGSVISYGGLRGRDVNALRRLVQREYEGRVAVTPYRKLGTGEVAVTSWGKLLHCEGVHDKTLRRFLDKHVAEDVGNPDH